MSEDLLTTIFEPFFTTKDVGKGSGLGLSMVYGFVTQSGGNIKVYSEEGVGTRFQLYMPSVQPDCAPLPVHQPEKRDLEPPTGTETILLVEDEPDFLATTTRLLEDFGYTVIDAANGPAAMKLLEDGQEIDMLLTDMVMPGGMNGHELADIIHERSPDLSILLTSGYPRDAFSQGRRYRLLQKPFTEHALAVAVRKTLESKPEI